MCPWLIHAVLQVLDGVLTFIGVTSLPAGIDAEGNPAIRFLMSKMGPGMALLSTKISVLACIPYLQKAQSGWVMLKRAIDVINWLYTVSACVWIYILLSFWGFVSYG